MLYINQISDPPPLSLSSNHATRIIILAKSKTNIYPCHGE